MHFGLLEPTVVNWVSLWFRYVDDTFTLFNNNNGSKSVSVINASKERQKNRNSQAYFSFFLTHLKIKTFIHPR